VARSEWSAAHTIQGGFALALACLAAVAAASYLSLVRFAEDEARLTRTDLVLNRLLSLRAAESAAESRGRGYLISGDEADLGPFRKAVGQVNSDVAALRQLTAGNSVQQQRLAALAPLLGQQTGGLESLIGLRRTQGFEAARQALLIDSERKAHDSVVALTDEMMATESELLAQREARSRRSTLSTEAAVIASGALAVLLVGIAVIAMRRDLAGRQRAEQALRAFNEHLELRVAERTAELARMNDSLQRSERRFRAFVNATSDAIYEMSPDWSELRRLDGRNFIPDTTAPRRDWLEKYVHPDDRAQLLLAVGEAIRARSTFELEHRVIRVDGTVGWVFSRAIPIVSGAGEVTEWFGAASDVTERKEAEAKLRSQLERLNLLDQVTRAISERQDVRSILQGVSASLEARLHVELCCILRYDAAGDYLAVAGRGLQGAQLAEELGIREGARVEIESSGLTRCLGGQLVYEPDVRRVRSVFLERLAGAGLRALAAAPLLVESRLFGILVTARRAPDSFSSAECEFLRQLSEHVAVAAQQAQLYQSLQAAYDDLRHSQQTVMQHERLLALGKMASGVAHDINNAISPIGLYTHFLLRRENGLSATARSQLEIIQRAADDVAETVARMREFYRSREPQQPLLPLDLNRVVRQAIDLTSARWSDMAHERGVVIDVRPELAADLPAVAGIESELRDALTNLIFNAVDAMPEGGTLWLRTCVAGGGAAEPGGAVVQLDVIDTGVGMDEDTRRRCIEPFFTTKGERGTGLGLAMVYGAMQRHGAELEVQSEPGKGTCMRLSFPVRSASADAAAAAESARAIGPLRILLVDDDPLILKSLGDTLEADGHRVRTADGGQAGIDAFQAAQSAGAPFQAVITDLGMPHVDGRKVAAAVKTAAPDTLVVLLTGWGRRMVSDGELPAYVDRILGKPPKLAELHAALALHADASKSAAAAPG
jgi:signal transduction histidine kinase/CHASE3 domain sensor protein/ActR/RegA family two-component response regulator